MTDTVIRAAEVRDQERWRELWAAYLRFYRSSVSEETTANTWQMILDAESDVHALVAESHGRVVGICNYLFHASTWSSRPTCYLQDLFVDPAARGGGAARRLILACKERAHERDACGLYWMTQEYNGAARSLYDTITPRSSFVVYEMNL